MDPPHRPDVVIQFFDLAGAEADAGTSGGPGTREPKRVVARRLLARALGVPVADLSLTYSAMGKPSLCSPFDSLHFSLSYADDLIAIATSFTHPIGLDVEQVADKPGLRSVASTRFTPRELAAMDVAPSQCSFLIQFYRSWVTREAYVKLIGTGLAGLRRAPGHPNPGSASERCSSFALPGDVPTWFLEGPAPMGTRFALAAHQEFSSYSLQVTSLDPRCDPGWEVGAFSGSGSPSPTRSRPDCPRSRRPRL